MIVDLPNTNTNDINKKINGLREEGGAITLSRFRKANPDALRHSAAETT